MRPTHDEGHPARCPNVSSYRDPATSSATPKDDTFPARDNTCGLSVPQHIELPRTLTRAWVSALTIGPAFRAVTVDGLGCEAWDVEAVRALAYRVAGRPFQIVMAKPSLDFWLRADIRAIEAWVLNAREAS